MTYVYDLTLGLPHTNHRFLSEHHLLKAAGHYQWQSIAAAAGLPLSRLRTSTGGEVYATFYYIEERVPETAALESFRLDDTVRFAVALRAFKNIAVEGRLVFDRADRMRDARRVDAALAPDAVDAGYPFIRFANIFITPEKGNSRLRVAPPEQADFSGLPLLPNEENPYHLTRAAAESGTLGVIETAGDRGQGTGDRPARPSVPRPLSPVPWSWTAAGSYEHRYAIDVDRDTNGAGLVYFANYVTFMDTAERLALEAFASDLPERRAVAERSLRHRRIAYYGNADVADTLAIRVTVFRGAGDALAFRYTIERQEDRQVICLSESIKALPERW
jgi:probable biosynthetic protein (TIGR04098 family)